MLTWIGSQSCWWSWSSCHSQSCQGNKKKGRRKPFPSVICNRWWSPCKWNAARSMPETTKGGTFDLGCKSLEAGKACTRPFSQLFTINAFVRKEDQVKQEIRLQEGLEESTWVHSNTECPTHYYRFWKRTLAHLSPCAALYWGKRMFIPLDTSSLEETTATRFANCVQW